MVSFVFTLHLFSSKLTSLCVSVKYIICILTPIHFEIVINFRLKRAFFFKLFLFYLSQILQSLLRSFSVQSLRLIQTWEHQLSIWNLVHSRTGRASWLFADLGLTHNRFLVSLNCLFLTDLGKLILLVIHHILVKLFMGSDSDKMINLRIESTLLSFFQVLLMGLDFTFHVFISLIPHESFIMILWPGGREFRYCIDWLRRPEIWKFLVSLIYLALLDLAFFEFTHYSFRKFCVWKFGG